VSGAAKISIGSGFNQVTPAIEKGAKMRILAGALNLPSLCMYSANSAVQSLRDLEGKTVGVGALGSVLHVMTVLLMRRKGVNPDLVTFRNVGSNADVFKAVAAKTVHGGLSDVDVYDQQAKYGVHALPDGKLWEQIPDYTNQATYATDDAIRQDRDTLVRTLAAYGKAYRFVSSPDSREAWVRARQKVTGANNDEQAVTQWNWIQSSQPWAKDLVLSDGRINLVQQVNLDFRNQSRMLPVADLADMSLAKDALKLLEREQENHG
jgi:ABC-type nitrate/sulfonate/bicarbonate transport system substrate-binding protein